MPQWLRYLQCIILLLLNVKSIKQLFCFTLLSNDIEMIIQIVLTVFSVGLIGDAIRKFCAMRGSHNSHVTKMYVLVLLWWGTFVASNSYSVVVYIISKNSVNIDQMSTLTNILLSLLGSMPTPYSGYYFLSPTTGGKQITDLFSHVTRGSGSEVTFEDAQQYKGIERKMYLTLKFYFYLRLFFLGLPIGILLSDNSLLIIFYKTMIAALLFDCVIITCSLVIGMYSLKTTKQLREQLDEDQSKRIFNQYLLIIVANTIRFGFDISYIVNSILMDAFFRNACPDYANTDQIKETIVNTCTIIFSHFLPIFIILRIYNLEDKPQEMCKSLIIASTSKDI